jgi:hypothetical protein
MLSVYQEGHEQEIWGLTASGGKMTIFDRDARRERVEHYSLLLNEVSEGTAKRRIEDIQRRCPGIAPLRELSVEVLEALRPHILEVATWTTEHLSWSSWRKRLLEAGFEQARVTYSGGWLADRLFSSLSEEKRPKTLPDLDNLLAPVARIASSMQAPEDMQSDDSLFLMATK